MKEKESAIGVADGGGVSENEQLVWVLWKILRGDGNDVSVAYGGTDQVADLLGRLVLIRPPT